jgi:ABC-type multidrug transport system fused ATPase/permease subunit
MKENLTDKQKLEIENYVEEKVNKTFIGGYETIDGIISFIVGFCLLILGIIFLFLNFIWGIIMIIVGILFINSMKKSSQKIERKRKEKKEKMIKEIQLKALKGEKWKN